MCNKNLLLVKVQALLTFTLIAVLILPQINIVHLNFINMCPEIFVRG